ncbi:MAG: ATPase, T2SS/T4P/T4SS family, partial [Nanoarchaeota archaeon]
MKTYIVDTSVVIERVVSRMIKEKKIKGKILVPHAVVSELEAQANRGLEIGFIGLEELQELQKLQNKELEIAFIGERPDEHQIRYAKSGEIDAYIRNLAKEQKAILITGDKVQAESAKAFGLEVMHLQLRVTKEKLTIEEFFDEHTMSVHIKENCLVYGKKGLPGHWELVPVNDKKLTGEEIEAMTKEIFEKTRVEEGSFVEINRKGSTIVQHKNFRIVIVRPPVSDGWEITIVRPLKKLNIEDYQLEPKIRERLDKSARGVMIAGEVGSGKSTFCQALGEYYANKQKIVKTVESPRDLQLKDEITQYSKNFADSEEIHDILFLS